MDIVYSETAEILRKKNHDKLMNELILLYCQLTGNTNLNLNDCLEKNIESNNQLLFGQNNPSNSDTGNAYIFRPKNERTRRKSGLYR